jgi:antitoxin (DNA-binding transcriptional repressor) of toxin-antitoxin stability system
MPGSRTMRASEFKAKCLDILDRIRSKELERVVVTKRGVPVASSCGLRPRREKSRDYTGFYGDPSSFRPRLISRHPSPTKPLPPMRVRYTGEPEHTYERSVAGHLRRDLACQW